MIILMPYEDLDECARVFDVDQLWRQLSSLDKLLLTLTDKVTEWQRHATVQLWRGYEEAAGVFATYIHRELLARRVPGAKEIDPSFVQYLVPGAGDWLPEMPDWVGCQDIHVSHRAFLLSRNPAHYQEKFPNLTPSVRLAWPE